jgi:hypothetical protein
MTAHAAVADGKTTRRQRREAAARRAPWGAGAPRSLVERRPGGPRLRIDYLVRHATGVSVTTPDGTRVGSVERLVTAPYDFWPGELVVRSDAGQRIRIDAQRIVKAYPHEERLVVRAA